MSLCDLCDHRFSQHVKSAFVSCTCYCIVCACDRGITLDIYVELSKDSNYIFLLEVGVHLDLVDSGSDLTASQQVK